MTQDKYVSFYEAKELLAIKLDELSDEEFWMWCFMGNENGGLNAYISEKLDNNIKWHIANTFNWPSGDSIEKYAVRAWSWFFLHSDIENFKPTKRFISGQKLLVRWKSKVGGTKKAENLIKISINKLPEINENIPSHPKISNYYPDLIGLGDDGLGGIYLLDEVIAVEKFTHMPEQETETQAEAVEDVGLVSHAETETKPKALSKMEKQQAAILEVIKAKRFKPMAIPDGEKGTIKSICEIDYKDDLFKAGTAFDAAWKKGIGKLWQMEHHESYAHRGNN